MRRNRRYAKNLVVEKHREVNVARREAYKYVRRLKGFTRYDVGNWTGYCKIINTFHTIIAESIVNNPEGVFIEDLGYFGILLYRYKDTAVSIDYIDDWDEIYLNPKTDGAVFTFNFTPIPKPKCAALRTFSMDGTFSNPTRKKISKNLQSGMKYRNNLEMFLKLLKND